ncbi:uncharacterized protein LOC115753693 isoform X2 [Rhodamnia argentea]|uniref:Uncharacterized protein LOC115753693 isoform X2 n=1 Tax=Rhodamnia argentea TaxID=178133 RepID=A0ABM3HCD1_9MYRT|nr:uncharacterized protein LOC115753693 isoform X2 [Rhodamnia argentea]
MIQSIQSVINFSNVIYVISLFDNKEFHVNMSSEGTTNDVDSQNGGGTTEAMPTVVVSDQKYRRLFEAAVKGDWKSAEKILDQDPEAMTAECMTVKGISITVLHVAVKAAQDQFVENLVKRLAPTYKVPSSALHDAAREGRIRMVKALVDRVDAKDENAKDEILCFALAYAISWAPMQKEVIWYLARRVKQSAPSYGAMSSLIMAGHMDVLLHLAERFPDLVKCQHTDDDSLLGDLAKMKSHFRSGARLNFWENFIYKCIPLCLVDTYNSKDMKMDRARERFKISLWNLAIKIAPIIKRIGESKLKHKYTHDFAELVLTKMKDPTNPEMVEFLLTSDIVLKAASHGISEIVKLSLEHFPELKWEENFTKELIKEVVKGRNVELFRLVNTHNTIPRLTDDMWMKDGLKEAVVEWSPRRAPTDVSGAAFLMQREIQWFKVLENRSDPSFKSQESREEKTCWEVFVEERKNLLKEAAQWMKDTSSSCSVVATLITTVAFAAVFTVPGGNNSITGIPISISKGSFMVFAVADALALFSSVTATLMFLGILTSRYEIEDFLHSLPRKMLWGLTSLFVSLACMLVAFGFALAIVLSERFKWIYIPITLLAAFPVIWFTILQLPLCVQMVKSTNVPHLYLL